MCSWGLALAPWWLRRACGFADVEDLKDREADEKMSVDCGMGHVPDKSDRFLYFWNALERERWLERDR